MPSGTLIQRIHSHASPSVIAPPTTGPLATASLRRRPAASAAGSARDARAPRLVGRFADAFESGDVDAIVALLTDDAWLTMPPLPLEYQGPTAIARFLSTVPAGGDLERFRLVATRANEAPGLRMDRPAQLARLEQQQHPPGEVPVRVGVETDALNETVDIKRNAEHILRAGRLALLAQVRL